MQVDPQLLQHRGLVLDHEHGGTQNVGRPVDLEAGRQGRKADVPPSSIAWPAANASSFQDLIYTTIYDN
jgi:hypothetical protein